MGLFDKIREGLKKTSEAVTEQFETIITTFNKVDEEMLEELCDAMILADMGAKTADEITEKVRAYAKRKSIETGRELQNLLCQIIEQMMVDDTPMNLETSPSVILVIGVNGVGKTTTIGKLAHKYQSEGKKVILGAADTFRAAAAEQLTIWAKRANVDIVRHQEGADPAAVVFDTIQAGKSRGADVIICDTAGRLHNKANLMNELNKISRVIDRELPDACRETLLVLDATTGQNAVSQANEFNKVADISGIVLTKLDGTAKGGIVVAISAGLEIPVKFIGVGEAMDDLMEFEKADFVRALFDLEPMEENENDEMVSLDNVDEQILQQEEKNTEEMHGITEQIEQPNEHSENIEQVEQVNEQQAKAEQIDEIENEQINESEQIIEENNNAEYVDPMAEFEKLPDGYEFVIEDKRGKKK